MDGWMDGWIGRGIIAVPGVALINKRRVIRQQRICRAADGSVTHSITRDEGRQGDKRG